MSLSLRDRVAHYFTAHPNTWVSMQQLAHIGGTGGWRSRVVECRTQLGMHIDNQQRRVQGITISEYRYRPPQPADLFQGLDQQEGAR
jgi:hypothetical protein